jgi:hypothetical protein
MNLKEHIIKVLKEEASFILSGDRYINLIKKVVLDYVDFDICKLVVDKLENTKDQYYVIMIVEKPLRSDYREKLQDFLNEVIPLTIYVSIADGMDCKTYMKVEHPKQVSESKVPSQVLRRHNLIDDLFKTVRSRFSKRICDYRHPDHFLNTIYERTLEDLYHAWFYDVVTDEEWDVASKYIEEYLDEKYRESTVMYWYNECKRRSGLYETELNERCWKGYTQKGMKTMFGKRYPNCVKKTK